MTEDSEHTGKKKRKRTKSMVPPAAPRITSPTRSNSSEKSSVEKVNRESAEAIAREQEKRKESKYDRTVEIANYCEANDKLQETVIGLIEKTNNSAQALETAQAEKEALEKRVQELVRIENERRALQEAENAKKLKLMAEEKERSLLEAKREAEKRIQEAEDAKMAAIQEGEEQLAILRRQVIVGNLYPSDTSVMESTN